jgi:hypothetical protein
MECTHPRSTACCHTAKPELNWRESINSQYKNDPLPRHLRLINYGLSIIRPENYKTQLSNYR